MSVFQAVVLGIVQGLTEFLPVSSSGHLIFFPRLLGWADQGIAFDAVIHLGTLLAVLFYFRADVRGLLGGGRRITGYLLLSAVPAAVVGFFFGDMIETAFRAPRLVAWNLIGWGAVLGLADVWSKKQESKKARKQLADVRLGETAAIGIAQALALLPGTSRSGITMTAGLFSGLGRKAAAQFSFLMSIPVIALAGGKTMIDLANGGVDSIGTTPLVIGFFASALSGFLAISLLMRVVERRSFLPFVLYRFAIGVIILLYLA